jgi:hypothetical protein
MFLLYYIIFIILYSLLKNLQTFNINKSFLYFLKNINYFGKSTELSLSIIIFMQIISMHN